MTTYSYTLTLDDSEHIALEYALKLTISHCELEMSEGPKCPYWAHKHSCESMLTKLRHTKGVLRSSYSPEDDSITLYSDDDER